MAKNGRLDWGKARSSRSAWLLACVLAVPVAAKLNSAPTDDARPPDPNQLAREVIHNELEAQINDKSLWHYREIQQKDGKSRTLDVCQTKDGEIDRLVAVNDEPLSSKQIQAEDQRIQKLVTQPGQLDSMEKKRKADGEQERALLRSFPEAFRFHCAGNEGGLVKLAFSPSPTFRPLSHAEQVFHHMEGTLTIDLREKRMAELNGRLTSEVKFWGGLLGHLDQGGTFLVKQQDVGSGHWEMTYMNVQMDGKALFFKTIAVREREEYSDFRPVPANISLSKAAELLKNDAAVHVHVASAK
jgi:hypothetical protein